MAKPEAFEVQQVLSREEWEGNKGTMVTYEILLADSPAKWKASVAADLDPGLEDGQQVKGWKNEDGKFGIATGGSSNGGQSRSKGSSAPVSDDDTRRSIERQVAYKEAMRVLGPFYEGMNEETFAAALRQLTDVGHEAIRGE